MKSFNFVQYLLFYNKFVQFVPVIMPILNWREVWNYFKRPKKLDFWKFLLIILHRFYLCTVFFSFLYKYCWTIFKKEKVLKIKEYDCLIQELKVTNHKIDNFCLNELETRRFPFELYYSLCFVECNCSTS